VIGCRTASRCRRTVLILPPARTCPPVGRGDWGALAALARPAAHMGELAYPGRNIAAYPARARRLALVRDGQALRPPLPTKSVLSGRAKRALRFWLTTRMHRQSPAARAIRNIPATTTTALDGLRDVLTHRCESFGGDGCRHDSHRAKIVSDVQKTAAGQFWLALEALLRFTKPVVGRCPLWVRTRTFLGSNWRVVYRRIDVYA